MELTASSLARHPPRFLVPAPPPRTIPILPPSLGVLSPSRPCQRWVPEGRGWGSLSARGEGHWVAGSYGTCWISGPSCHLSSLSSLRSPSLLSAHPLSSAGLSLSYASIICLPHPHYQTLLVALHLRSISASSPSTPPPRDGVGALRILTPWCEKRPPPERGAKPRMSGPEEKKKDGALAAAAAAAPPATAPPAPASQRRIAHGAGDRALGQQLSCDLPRRWCLVGSPPRPQPRLRPEVPYCLLGRDYGRLLQHLP